MGIRSGTACALLALGAASQPANAQDPEWSGCYQVDRGGWDWTRENEDSTQFQTPEVLQLLPTPQTGSPRGFEVRPSIMSYDSARGGWQALGPDSLSILWSNGFTGILMKVGRAGDSLIGTATAFTDNGPMFIATVRVVMKPTNCERLRGGGVARNPGAHQRPKPESHRGLNRRGRW